MDIREIALRDPVAAYGIWQGIQTVPFGFNLLAAFPTLSSSTGFPVKAATPEAALAQRVWIHDITYSVQCPNLFAGELWKPTFDAGLRKSPGVDVFLDVIGGLALSETGEFTPLENLTNLVRGDRWPAGWPLFPQQIVQGTFVLKQAPGGRPSNLGPYNLTITFLGWQFLDDSKVGEMDPLEAARLLREAGILTTKDVPRPPRVVLGQEVAS